MRKSKNMHLLWVLLIICILVIGIYFIWKYAIKKEGFDNTINYLDGVDIVYWINLDRSTDRRKHMEELLKDESFNGIPNERISAYDGINNEKEVFNKLNILNKNAKNVEYAVLLSHLEAIRTFSNSDKEIALIVEDDVTLDYKKYWDKDIKTIIENAPIDWEILQLTFAVATYLTVDSYPIKEYEPRHTDYYSACAYLINKKCSDKIKNIYVDNKYIIDKTYGHQSDVYIFEYMKTYTYYLPYFVWESKAKSTILSEHDEWNNNSRKLLDNYMNEKTNTYILVTTYYKTNNSLRQSEINDVLKLNNKNKNISKIYLLNNQKYDITNIVGKSNKIEQIVINNEQNYKLKFKDAIQFINNKPFGNLYILANSDIYFDTTLLKVKYSNMNNKVYALLRYDLDNKNTPHIFTYKDNNKGRNDSQDTWIFKNPLKINLNNLDFSFGTLGCDNRFAYEIYNASYKIENPALDIITYHKHESNVRTYSEKNRLKGKYLFLTPHKLDELPIMKVKDS
jgi:GR25 family glycosyltransferase involved in LPS biosynthesis